MEDLVFKARFIEDPNDSRLLIEGNFDKEFLTKNMYFVSPYSFSAIDSGGHVAGQPGHASYRVSSKKEAIALHQTLSDALKD